MARKRGRRFWSDEEKARICRQARVPGVSVSQVARRYDVNANMVFTWLRDDRYGSADEQSDPHGAAGESTACRDEARFLPVEIVEHDQAAHARADGAGSRSSPTNPSSGMRSDDTGSLGSGVLEVDLACGHRLRIVGSYDPDVVAHLIRSLSA